MEIQRNTYLNQLIAGKQNGLIKIVTGIRRCGKSYLLFRIFKNHLLESGVTPSHIIEIALDSIENEALRNPNTCYTYIKERIVDDAPYYILLDEVQLLPRFEEVLNSLLRLDNTDIYVTGSNSRFLSTDIVTEFRGRGYEIRIHPLSFAESYAAQDEDFDDAWQTYMTYGGLPALLLLPSEQLKQNYLEDIFKNVYIRDVIDRNNLRCEPEIGTLVDVLASSIGSPTNPTKIANTFQTQQHITYTNKTISNHISYLEEAFLIDSVKRYDIKGRKYISGNQKYYFTDLGLRNARLNFRQQEPTHIMENIVYNELRIRGFQVDVGYVESYEKNSAGNTVRKQLEVDFVANQGSVRYYIQVAYELSRPDKQEQEFSSIRKIPDFFKKIIIVGGTSKPWRNDEGFVIMSLKYFLLQPDSLEF